MDARHWMAANVEERNNKKKNNERDFLCDKLEILVLLDCIAPSIVPALA